MDAFSDVLRVIRLSGGVFLEAELTAPWCISGRISPDDCKPFLAAPRHVIAFHFIAAGGMRLPSGGEWRHRCARGGDRAAAAQRLSLFWQRLASRTSTGARDYSATSGRGLARIVYGGGGEKTQLLCGYLGCDAPFSPLLAALPKVLKLDVRTAPSGAWIESSFRFAASEIAAGRLGSTTVIAKLSELLFIEAVSQFVACLPAERRGWLAGLRDPQIGRALASLHSRPTEEWTAKSLAREVSMSRSAFAERFTALVGQPPMQYLALWRMHMAGARQLRGGAQQRGPDRVRDRLRIGGGVQSCVQAAVRRFARHLAQALRIGIHASRDLLPIFLAPSPGRGPFLLDDKLEILTSARADALSGRCA